jgi:hypothetical protein
VRGLVVDVSSVTAECACGACLPARLRNQECLRRIVLPGSSQSLLCEPLEKQLQAMRAVSFHVAHVERRMRFDMFAGRMRCP